MELTENSTWNKENFLISEFFSNLSENEKYQQVINTVLTASSLQLTYLVLILRVYK